MTSTPSTRNTTSSSARPNGQITHGPASIGVTSVWVNEAVSTDNVEVSIELNNAHHWHYIVDSTTGGQETMVNAYNTDGQLCSDEGRDPHCKDCCDTPIYLPTRTEKNWLDGIGNNRDPWPTIKPYEVPPMLLAINDSPGIVGANLVQNNLQRERLERAFESGVVPEGWNIAVGETPEDNPDFNPDCWIKIIVGDGAEKEPNRDVEEGWPWKWPKVKSTRREVQWWCKAAIQGLCPGLSLTPFGEKEEEEVDPERMPDSPDWGGDVDFKDPLRDIPEGVPPVSLRSPEKPVWPGRRNVDGEPTLSRDPVPDGWSLDDVQWTDDGWARFTDEGIEYGDPEIQKEWESFQDQGIGFDEWEAHRESLELAAGLDILGDLDDEPSPRASTPRPDGGGGDSTTPEALRRMGIEPSPEFLERYNQTRAATSHGYPTVCSENAPCDSPFRTVKITVPPGFHTVTVAAVDANHNHVATTTSSFTVLGYQEPDPAARATAQATAASKVRQFAQDQIKSLIDTQSFAITQKAVAGAKGDFSAFNEAEDARAKAETETAGFATLKSIAFAAELKALLIVANTQGC